MAVSRVSTSSIAQGFPKSRSLLAGNDWSATWLIQRQTLAANATNLTFSSIPQGYKHLQIRLFGRTDRATVASGDWIKIQLNSDTATNYSLHSLYGDGASAAATAGASANAIESIRLASAASNTGGFGGIIIDILDYTSTSKNKTIRALGGYDNNGAGQVGLTSGSWFKSPIEAVNNIKLTPGGGTNFVQYTTVALYGVL